MVAAVAATMASASIADISIKGDAYIQYADNDDISVDIPSGNADNQKRVNLDVIGKSGVTTVFASFRTDDDTAARSKASNLHQFYITTKVGPVNIKAGDFYGTVGLGAWTKSTKKTDAISLSTKVGPVTLGMFTADTGSASGTTNISVAAKVAGTTVKLINNYKAEWTDLSVKGAFNGISVAAERWRKKKQTNSAKKSISLIHVGGKAGVVKWDVVQYKSKDLGKDDAQNAKFAPLGSMLIGKNARGYTATAVANAAQFSKISGVAVSTKMAGNTIKAIYSRNTLVDTVVNKVTGAELILTRAVFGGKLTANLAKAKFSNQNNTIINKGIRFDVKF